MGSQQLKICLRLQPAFALGRIPHHMGKNIGIGIHTGFISLRIHVRPCQNLTVGRPDFSPYHLLRKGILSRVIRTVDKIFAADHLKINQIANQRYENRHKKIGNNRKLPVSGTIFLRFTRGILDIAGFVMCVCLFRLEIFLPALVVFVFFPQFPHLHLPSIYKVLG